MGVARRRRRGCRDHNRRGRQYHREAHPAQHGSVDRSEGSLGARNLALSPGDPGRDSHSLQAGRPLPFQAQLKSPLLCLGTRTSLDKVAAAPGEFAFLLAVNRRCRMQRWLAIAVAVASLVSSMSAQDRSHARSMVITRYGIVATSYALASQAGAQILARGGSAVDAAIAANAVLGVGEPMMNGMGGDLFAIYWEAKTGKLYGLNSSGWAPSGLSIEHLRARDVTQMPESGIDTVTVPGAVAGWG